MSSGWRTVPARPDVIDASGWTLRVVDVSGEPLDSLDICHHPGGSQILTTTNAPASPLAGAYGREVRGAKWNGRTLYALCSL